MTHISGEEIVIGGDPAAAQRIVDDLNEHARKVREEEKRRLAMSVPDIAGRDIGINDELRILSRQHSVMSIHLGNLAIHEGE